MSEKSQTINGCATRVGAGNRPVKSRLNIDPIGAISSLLGVAGGEVIIPTLVFGYGVPVKAAGSLSMLISLSSVLTGIVRRWRSDRRPADRPSSGCGYQGGANEPNVRATTSR
jgi:hypothetical protein